LFSHSQFFLLSTPLATRSWLEVYPKSLKLTRQTGKAAVLAQRTNRLASRNPSRLERQIAELKALETRQGKLNARDQKQLDDLENDVQRVKKAREVLGDKAPSFIDKRREHGKDGAGVGGKRKREWEANEQSSETDEDVRRIPMPRDTPPPIPFQSRPRKKLGNANLEPLGEGRGGGERGGASEHELPAKPEAKPQPKTVYESKPVVRDLRREAVSRFVPAVVAQKIAATKGQGRLLEEEEVERLEEEGYGVGATKAGETQGRVMMVDAAPAVDGSARDASLEAEEERFERELRGVQMEEVEDEDL